MEQIYCAEIVDICELIPSEKYIPIKIKGKDKQMNKYMREYGFIIDGKAYIPEGDTLLIYEQGEFII